jgi:hypothetical protein
MTPRCHAPHNLTDERVNIDHQPLGARAGARPPRPGQQLAKDTIELADMPERGRPE